MIDIYQKILTKAAWMRGIQKAVADNYKDQLMRCPVHLSIGQEIQWAIFSEKKDYEFKIFSSHRGHLPFLAIDGDLKKYFSELYLDPNGISNGRLGSMHIKSPMKGHITSVPIVGSSIPLAVGAGFSKKQMNYDWIPIANFGDGACEEGIFHESLNLASVLDIPVLFFCENNLYSCTTNIQRRQPSSDMSRFAKAAKIEIFKSNSYDLKDCEEKVKDALDFIQNFSKPAFLEINCYRFYEHCGNKLDKDMGDREEIEFNKFWEKDLINNNFKLCYVSESYNRGYIDSTNLIEILSKSNLKRLKNGFK